MKSTKKVSRPGRRMDSCAPRTLAVAALLKEAERFKLLAGQYAVTCLMQNKTQWERLMRDHLIRAETFKDAATLVKL